MKNPKLKKRYKQRFCIKCERKLSHNEKDDTCDKCLLVKNFILFREEKIKEKLKSQIKKKKNENSKKSL